MHIDEGFMHRTYRTSIVVWAIVAIMLLSVQKWFVALGFTVGAAISLGVLASLDYIVRRVFVPGKISSGRSLTVFSAFQLTAVVSVVIGVVLTRRVDVIIGFCVGLILTQAIMVLKVVGIALNKRLGQ